MTDEMKTAACLVDHEDSRGVCLQLIKDEQNQLWDQEKLVQPLETLQPEEQYIEKSLGKLLEIVKPTYAAKRVLGLILARSILHLFGGPWISPSLCINDISLYCKVQNDQPYPFFDKIFISTVFKTRDSQHSPQSGPRSLYSVHPFPTILALGIILTEIELGDDLLSIYGQLPSSAVRSRPFDLAKILLRECQLRSHMESGLLSAVKFCIDRSSFLPFINVRSKALFPDQEFVNTYHLKVVRPLEEDLVRGAKWTWDEVNWLERRNLDDDGVCKIIAKIEEIELSQHNVRQTRKRHQGDSSTLIAITEESDGVINKIRQSTFNGAKQPQIPTRSQTEDFNRSEFLRGPPFIPSTTLGKPLQDQHTYIQGSSRPRTRDDFEIAIICALPLEASAVLCTFDKHWDKSLYTYGKEPKDPNSYSPGVISGRNVILAHPPGIGKATAASVAAACAMSFKQVKLALVVGVCGGVPIKTNKEEILLGDVIISKGVVQYDFGRQFSDHFRRKMDVEDLLGRPNAQISSLLAKLETKTHRKSLQYKIADILAQLGSDGPFYPEDDQDKLFRSTYRHKHHDSGYCAICDNCEQNTDSVCDVALESICEETACNDTELVHRRRQNQKNKPLVHIGLFASGDSVVKSGVHRDKIAKEANIIAFEMEGAGVWDRFPCVIIKGVCDYADSHKNKLWQEYAATTAAACTKAFIQHWQNG